MPMTFWELATLAPWQVALQWSRTAICPAPDRIVSVALGVGVGVGGLWKTWALAPIFSRLPPVDSLRTPSDSEHPRIWGRAVRKPAPSPLTFLPQCGDAAAVPGQLPY